MFQRSVKSVPSFLQSLRFMCSSNGVPTKSPFVREQVRDLPFVETVFPTTFIDTHLSSRKVTYGDYEFMECTEGYILCYINAYVRRKEPHDVFYGVFYGTGHPLNATGSVKYIQTLPHATLAAVAHAIESFPKIEAKKLCICTNCTRTMKKTRDLQNYLENGYRSVLRGTVLQTKKTMESLTETIRSRNDLQIRLLRTPEDVVFNMRQALKLASKASSGREVY